MNKHILEFLGCNCFIHKIKVNFNMNGTFVVTEEDSEGDDSPFIGTTSWAANVMPCRSTWCAWMAHAQ